MDFNRFLICDVLLNSIYLITPVDWTTTINKISENTNSCFYSMSSKVGILKKSSKESNVKTPSKDEDRMNISEIMQTDELYIYWVSTFL